MAVDVLVTVADKLEHLDSPTSRVVSVSKTMPSVNHRIPQVADCLVSLLPLLLLRLGALKPRSPALAPVLAAYSVVKINQPSVACLELPLLERPVAASSGLLVVDSAQERQTIAIPLVGQVVCSGSRTTINRNNHRNHSLVVEQLRLREDSELAALDLELGIPTPLVAVYSAVGRQTIPSVSHSRIKPRTHFQALVRRARLRTMPPPRLEDLVKTSSKTRSRVVCLAPSQAPILEVACLGLRITLNSKMLEDSSAILRIITKLLLTPCLGQSLPQQPIFSATQTPTLLTPVEGFLEGWATTPIRTSKTQRAAFSVGTIHNNRSLVFLELPSRIRTLEAACSVA